MSSFSGKGLKAVCTSRMTLSNSVQAPHQPEGFEGGKWKSSQRLHVCTCQHNEGQSICGHQLLSLDPFLNQSINLGRYPDPKNIVILGTSFPSQAQASRGLTPGAFSGPGSVLKSIAGPVSANYPGLAECVYLGRIALPARV